MTPSYAYACDVVRVIDGDTIVVHVDLGFRTWRRDEPIRLAHVDAPDSQPGKMMVTAYVSNLLPVGSRVLCRTFKPADKYGRWLASVELPNGWDLATHLLELRLVVPYEGGPR